MQPLSRRTLITRTSLGIAAIGALSAVFPLPALADGPAVNPTPAQPVTGPFPVPSMTMPGGAPFIVYISDPSTGSGSILVGEQAIPFTNSAIVQSLRQAMA